MEIINLATREKQDEILSYFPIKGGTDFHSGLLTASKNEVEPQYEIFTAQGKGIIIGLRNDSSNVTFEIFIKSDNGNGFIYKMTPDTNISCFFPFSTSIKIKSASNSAPNNVQVIYLLF